MQRIKVVVMSKDYSTMTLNFSRWTQMTTFVEQLFECGQDIVEVKITVDKHEDCERSE